MYTSQGYMTHEDYQEHLKDTDNGTTVIQMDDAPAWFTFPQKCPECGQGKSAHGSVTVQDASGEIIGCDQ